MKTFNKFIEEMASSRQEQPEKSALQKARERFAAKKAEAKEVKKELKSKSKEFGGRRFGKVKTRFTKQSGEKE